MSLIRELLGGGAASRISQPAVGLQVRQLEWRLGIRLIDQVGRRATATGEELLDHARRIDCAVMAALDAMRRLQGTVGRVGLGTGTTACIYFLPSILRSLRTPSLRWQHLCNPEDDRGK